LEDRRREGHGTPGTSRTAGIGVVVTEIPCDFSELCRQDAGAPGTFCQGSKQDEVAKSHIFNHFYIHSEKF
jgi:hypothetical protein